MTVQTITAHRALTLIAKAEESLNNKIRNGLYVSTVKGVTNRPTDRSYKNEAELRARIQSDTDAVESNLNLIVKLKTALSKKNLETFVDFKGTKTSITELLAIKTTLALRQTYANMLRNQISSANILAEKADEDIKNELANTDASAKINVQRDLQAHNGITIITHSTQSAATRLQQLLQENEFLQEEIDILLSETNLTTVLEYTL